MADDPERQKLDDLSARIQQAQGGSPNSDVTPPSKEARGGSAGYEMAGTVIGCIIIGWLIDTYFHTGPWGTLIMVLIGICGSFVNVWKALNGYDQSVGLHKKDDNKGNTDGR